MRNTGLYGGNSTFVSGVGLVSPYGCSLKDFFNGLTTMKSMLKPCSSLDIVKFPDPPAVEVCTPNDADTHEERILGISSLAIKYALEDWGGSLEDAGRVGLVVGSGLGLSDNIYNHPNDMEYLSRLGDKLAASCNLDCESLYIGNACCAGSQAVSYGMDLLEGNFFDVVIAGGIDVLSPMAYAGFLRLYTIDNKACRPFDRNRKGITVGEGAAFFILTRKTKYKDGCAKAYCRLAGSGVTNDAYHVVQMESDGTGIKHAIEQALSYAGVSYMDVNVIIAHGTGTIQNDRIEAKAILDFFGDHAVNIYVTAPKGAIGHTGGASGAFGLMTAIGVIQYGIVPPVLNLQEIDPECGIRLVHGKQKTLNPSVVLVNAFAFGGSNVVIACKGV